MIVGDIQAAPAVSWQARRFMWFRGQFDTRVKTGEDYPTQTLAKLWTMRVGDKPKGAGLAFIPSTYADFDAREHNAQRERGAYIALTGDVDGGDHALSAIRDAVTALAGDAAWLIYSSAHSRPGDQRWRIIMPLADPLPFDTWHDAQLAFFAFMQARGIEMDHALARAAQPVYLPNVPAVHAKSETPLRGDDGAPLYFERAATPLESPGLSIDTGPVAQGIAAIRHQRLEDELLRDRIRAEAEARRANKPRGDHASILEDFNATNSVATMLEICGYEQSPRHAEDWRSPHQTGETYATRIIGSKWISLSASDAASGLGERCSAGCFGDAYDLFAHYKHGGDHKAAFRALHKERRDAQPNVIYPPQFDPPAWLDDAPAYDEMPEWAESEPDMDDYDIPHVEAGGADPLVKATPFVWRDTETIPKREWLYGRHLLRKFVSVDVAAGGVGKTSLKIGEAIAMATGRDLYDKGLPEGPLSVWLWNLEDPIEEIERRVHATMLRFHIDPGELDGRFYADSGRDQPLVMATEGPDGARIVRPVVDAMIAEMIERRIDVLVVDPFVSSHAVSENDNNAIDIVAREWNVVAERTGAAINLVHHVRKGNGAEATAESARGASALIGKARSVLVYNRMTEDEASRLNVPINERFFYFRTDNDKANLAPPERGVWYRMNNVDLANGDSVGVACPWTPPDAFEGLTVRHLFMVQQAVSQGQWRENIQTKEAWVGNAVATALELDIEEKHTRKRIQTLLRTWIDEGVLEVVEDQDGKRNKRKFVVVGKWVNQ